MKITIKHISKIGLLTLFLAVAFGFTNDKDIKHKIYVMHPGLEIKEPIETILTEKRDAQGNTIEFYVTVESVICTDSTCKIVPVTIFWNPIGAYDRIELEDGDYLEKVEAVEFIEEDYLKLDRILRNKNSALADFDIEEITSKNKLKKENPDVDAVSGATIISIDASETIVGATLTSYTLWHWVNGEIPNIIKNFYIQKRSNEDLVSLLESNKELNLLTVDELTKRQAFNETVSHSIIELINSNNNAYRKKAFAYIEQLPEQLHFDAFRKIFNTKDDKIRFKALYVLKKSPFEFSKQFSSFLIDNVIKNENPKAIKKLLDIFDKRDINYKPVDKAIIKLLDAEDMSLTQNAYNFLKDKTLSKKQQKKINVFYNSHKKELEKNTYSGFNTQ
jgi:hypothetical protein